MQFGTLWHSKAVHGLNLQASAANLHIVKILRDIEGSFYNSYGIQGLEMTFWALYFHTPICHSAALRSDWSRVKLEIFILEMDQSENRTRHLTRNK